MDIRIHGNSDKYSFKPDAVRCDAVPPRAVDAFTPDALPYALRCIAVPNGAA